MTYLDIQKKKFVATSIVSAFSLLNPVWGKYKLSNCYYVPPLFGPAKEVLIRARWSSYVNESSEAITRTI